LKEYRALIYKIVEEDEESMKGQSEVLIDKKDTVKILEQNRSTIYKSRFKGLARSASKNKDESVPKTSQKEINTVSIKKKYESVFNKGRE
jgi:hypothetical protein